MIEQGFVVPELQVLREDPLDPSRMSRVDYFWDIPNVGEVIDELDGHDKYVDPDMLGGRSTVDALIDERHRKSRLSMKGVSIMRFTFKDVMNVDGFVQLLEAYGIPRGPARVMN